MKKTILAILILGLLITAVACGNPKASSTQPTNEPVAPTTVQADDGKVNPAPSENPQPGKIQSIADIKKVEYLGKTVTVHGIVVNNVKIGRISGYRINDSTESIPVSASVLPKVNTTVTVTGVVQNSSYFGLYIYTIN